MAPESCGTCPHLYYDIRTDFFPACPEYFCGYDGLELIGFVSVKPEWCKLELEKSPPMHYVIMKWESGELKWIVIHWTHSYEDVLRMSKEYPEDAGYVHLMDLRYLKVHPMMERVQEFREKAKAAQEKEMQK